MTNPISQMADNPHSQDPVQQPQADDKDSESLTFMQMLGSTLAAALGVQSSANRKRDFSKGKASHFILLGIGFTVMFVLAVIGVVNLVLP